MAQHMKPKSSAGVLATNESAGVPRHAQSAGVPRHAQSAGVSPQNESTETPSKEAQVGKSAALMSVLVIISRLTGFFRTWSQAYALGVTVTASCYSVANNLPNQLYELVIGGMLVTAFLPVYLSVKKRLGSEGASAYSSNLVSLVLILMGAVTIVGFIFAYQVVFTQSFSARADFDTNLAVYFFRFFVIEVVLYSLSSIFSGILNAERDYFWSSAAPIFNNFVTTASFFAYAFLHNTNPQLALLLLALGNPLGVAVQVLVQIPSLKKHGIHIRPYVNLRDPAIKDTLSIGIPSLIVMLCSFVTVSVQTSSALSVTAAGASISYYARLWYTLPYAILAVPITTAMFTELSDDVAKGDMVSYRRGVSVGTSKILFFMIPFMMYLIIFAVPLIQLLAAGSFSADEVMITASYLQALAVGLPAYGVCVYLQKVWSSLRHMKLYTVANIIAACVQVSVCLFLTPGFGLNMVALSSLFYFVVVDVLSFIFLRKRLGALGLTAVVSASARALVFGVLGSVVGFAILQFMGGLHIGSGTVVRAIVLLVAGGVPSVVVSFGLALLTHAPEMAIVQKLLHRGRA